MTKKKTTPIKDTPAAQANRLSISPLLVPRSVKSKAVKFTFDENSLSTLENMTGGDTYFSTLSADQPRELFFNELGPTPEQAIKWLQDLGWWGYLKKGEPGESRGIEVRLTN